MLVIWSIQIHTILLIDIFGVAPSRSVLPDKLVFANNNHAYTYICTRISGTWNRRGWYFSLVLNIMVITAHNTFNVAFAFQRLVWFQWSNEAFTWFHKFLSNLFLVAEIIFLTRIIFVDVQFSFLKKILYRKLNNINFRLKIGFGVNIISSFVEMKEIRKLRKKKHLSFEHFIVEFFVLTR